MVLYLDVLTVAAALWRRPAPAVPPCARFAVLVPAHNEELLLPRLLNSLAAQVYPSHLFDIHVVADNCTDATAHVAAAGGATVHQRSNREQVGKGYALQWLLAQLREQGRAYDAFVVLDADSTVTEGFLRVMNNHLARGDVAVQSYYGVLNHDEAWAATLRYVALALYNGLRPRGRDALGLSAALRGNGMCFAGPLLEEFGWDAYGLAEDAEFHLRLVEAGHRVTCAPQATVLAEMPVSLQQSHSQNVRWERGRLQLLRSHGARLLAQGLRRRDPVRLEALIEGLVPPLSVLMGVTSLNLLITALLRARSARRLATLVLLGQFGYVLAGLRLVRAGPRAYMALLLAPLYILWKVWLYTGALVGRDKATIWVRTARNQPAAGPDGGVAGPVVTTPLP